MKTIKSIVCASAVLAAGTLSAQSYVPSVADNPGTLGQSYTDLHFQWNDLRDGGGNAYDTGINANVPVARGVDAGLGYDYYWQNHQQDPFASRTFRSHTLGANLNLFAPTGSVKPFFGGGAGYEWTHGSLDPLRTYDHTWVWDAQAGVQVPFGSVALTPRISYFDTMDAHSRGTWAYGAEANHWFSEKLGGYVDATFHDPQGRQPEWWSYLAGLRIRF